MNWLFFKLFRVYSYSVKMSKEGNFSWCTCKPVVLLNKPTAVLTVSLPSPSSLLKLPSSRATTAEKCAKERDGRAKLLFCLSKPCLNPLLFCRSRYRRRRGCVNSLISYHNVLAKALSSLLLLTFSFLVKPRNSEMASLQNSTMWPPMLNFHYS